MGPKTRAGIVAVLALVVFGAAAVSCGIDTEGTADDFGGDGPDALADFGPIDTTPYDFGSECSPKLGTVCF